MGMSYNCLDCHGGDEKFAKFKFEELIQIIIKAFISSLKMRVLPAGAVIILTSIK